MAKGFKGLVIRDSNTSEMIQQFREDMSRDFKKRLKKIDKKEKKKNDRESDVFKKFSTLEAWNVMGQLQQNATARLAGLSQFAETTGPNAGKIVIPTLWDSKAQQLVGRLFDNYVAQEVDMQNGFGALRSIDLWTILAGDMGGGFGDSMFSQIMQFKFLTGQGLVAAPMFPGLPGVQNIFSLLLPRLLASSIATIAGV